MFYKMKKGKVLEKYVSYIGRNEVKIIKLTVKIN
jgi:hypothetical protein